MGLVSELYTAEVIRREFKKKGGKMKSENLTAEEIMIKEKEERVRKLLVDFVDKVCRSLYPEEPSSIFEKRTEAVDLIKLWVTERRTWL